MRLDLVLRDREATDIRIAALAERQGGVVAHGQLRGLGVSAAAIHRRVRAGRLHPRFRGVYSDPLDARSELEVLCWSCATRTACRDRTSTASSRVLRFTYAQIRRRRAWVAGAILAALLRPDLG